MRIITYVNKSVFICLFVFLLNINVQAEVFSVGYPVEQIIKEKTVTLNLKSKSIINILSEIQKQSGINYGFDRGLDPKTMGTFDITANNITVEKALNSLLESSKYTYRILDDMISIVEKTPVKSESGVTQKQETVTLSGKIIDESGAAVVGATVIIKGTSTGAISDNLGKFTIKAQIGSVLNISFSGMKEMDYKVVKADDKLVIKLLADALAVEDVVVTGLFDRKTTGFAGTVTTIKKEELQRVSTGNIFTTISTLDAGFKINENNIDGSNPNKLPDFTIRGKGSFQNNSTAPIFILDGFEVSSQKIFDMDVNRIESITLLKDASATILYGSRASNGVVVIETVAPKVGQLRVTYDFKPTIGFVDLSGYDIMNAREKLEYERLAGLYTNDKTLIDSYDAEQKYYEKYRNVAEGVDTYWLSQPVQTSFSHKHSLYVEGGVDNVRYGIDAAYDGNKGVMKESGRDRISMGFSLIYRIKDKITIRNYISYGYVKGYNSPYGDFSTYGTLNPYERIYNSDGSLALGLFDNVPNPLYDAQLPNRDFNRSQDFNEQLSLDWMITKGLRLRGQAKISKSNGDSELYKSPMSSKYVLDVTTLQGGEKVYLPLEKRGELSLSENENFSFSSNVTLNYNTVFAEKHILYLGIGGEIQSANGETSSYSVTGFADDRYSTLPFAIQFKEKSKPTGSESQTRSVGLFANINYIFDNRYFADISFRYDGSSRFGLNNKFAPFWSVGGGWNIHNEKSFFKSKKIDMLKLRVSYGVTGNQEFSAYQAKTMYQFQQDRLYDNLIPAMLMGYGNPDLKWQNQYQTNIGFDFGMINSRLRLSVNWYDKLTDGMLASVTVAPSIGVNSNSFTTNIGEIRNRGVEFNLNGVIIRKPSNDLEWSVMLQAANNKNKILKISNELKSINDRNNANKEQPQSVYEEGQSMSALKAVKSLGIDPTTGWEVFVKSDGTITYEWDANDKILCGDTEPKVFGNFGTNLFYKGWNLNLSFNYNLGADYYNQTLASRVEGANPSANADRRVLNDRWQTVGQHALYRNIKDYENTFVSTRFVQKEYTMRLSSLSLSYDFSRELLKKWKINTFRLSFYANDIFRVSTVKNERGLSYPFQQSYVFGLNIGF